MSKTNERQPSRLRAIGEALRNIDPLSSAFLLEQVLPVYLAAAADTRMLDWLQEQAELGNVCMSFELEGGVHVTLEQPSVAPRAARNVETIRAGITLLMDHDLLSCEPIEALTLGQVLS